MPEAQSQYDSILLVSFGGPEGPDDVMPFLENVLRGKNVPEERMQEVAEHYNHFGGISPINQQNRNLIAALRKELDSAEIDLPIYWGNRNWTPLLPDCLAQMRDDGRQRPLAFFTSIFSSYSGCRQYHEDIAAAQKQVGESAPVVEKLRNGFNHPSFIETQADLTRRCLQEIPGPKLATTKILFTAHSIPMTMADNSPYVAQLTEASRLVSKATGHADWELVFQSRSGPPHQPWLEPDVCDRIESLADEGISNVVIVPLGFISDHMEVLFDLDTEAHEACQKAGIEFIRAGSAGTHPSFVRMIRELIQERIAGTDARACVGDLAACNDVCADDCCLYPRR